MTKIILASGSPYRKVLLKKLIKDFEVKIAEVNEEVFKKKIKDPKKLVKRLALEKAKEIAKEVKKLPARNAFSIADAGREIKKLRTRVLVIGTDTLITIDDKIIGKAKNRKEAKEILLLLKGRTHQIMTGIVVLEAKTGKYRTALEETKVAFRDFTDKELEKFLDSEDWQGKAGAYGLQLRNFEFLKSYEGDYENILGLPLRKLALILKEFGVKMEPKRKKALLRS